MKPLKEILGNADSFRVLWGNSTQILLLGWTSLNFHVGDEKNLATLVKRYLVTSEEIEYPILGFNAIREIFNSTDHQKIDALVNYIATAKEETKTCVIIKGNDIAVPAG